MELTGSIDGVEDGVLVKEEEREEGVVKFSVYRMYWQSVGLVLAPVILFSLFLMQGKFKLARPVSSHQEEYIVLVLVFFFRLYLCSIS